MVVVLKLVADGRDHDSRCIDNLEQRDIARVAERDDEFALEAGCPAFINADLIALGLSPFSPEKVAIRAGRIMLESIAQHVAQRISFAFETTLSGRSYTQQIPHWQQVGLPR